MIIIWIALLNALQIRGDHNQPWLRVQLVARIKTQRERKEKKTQREALFNHLNGHKSWLSFRKAHFWPLGVLVSPIYPESSDLLALSEPPDHLGRKIPNLFLISAETCGIFGSFPFQTGNRKSHHQGLWGHEHFWFLLVTCTDFFVSLWFRVKLGREVKHALMKDCG